MPTAGPPPAPSAPDALGRCTYCGRPIAFRETPSGALQPWDVDPATGELTEVHFATCPARLRAKRERRLAQGKPADVPLDRCHLPDCGHPELRYLPPKGEGGIRRLWAARCLRCGIHRFLPAAFAPPAEALPIPEVAPDPVAGLPPYRWHPWLREWGWTVAGGWGWQDRDAGRGAGR
jgi:hypothetical protein